MLTLTPAKRSSPPGVLSKLHNTDEGEFAMLIADAYHRQGLGTELLRQLIQIGRDEGLRRIIAFMLRDNVGMRRVAERLGFELLSLKKVC